MNPESADLDHRLRVAEAVVREAGRVAADHFARRELLAIHRKGAQDLVSEADRACEDLIVEGLGRLFPGDGFLGEERGARNLDASALWVIDPIDGTHNFLTATQRLGRTAWRLVRCHFGSASASRSPNASHTA